MSPYDIKIYLRIYQTDQMFPYEPDPNEIKAIMDKMDEFDPEIEKMKEILL